MKVWTCFYLIQGCGSPKQQHLSHQRSFRARKKHNHWSKHESPQCYCERENHSPRKKPVDFQRINRLLSPIWTQWELPFCLQPALPEAIFPLRLSNKLELCHKLWGCSYLCCIEWQQSMSSNQWQAALMYTLHQPIKASLLPRTSGRVWRVSGGLVGDPSLLEGLKGLAFQGCDKRGWNQQKSESSSASMEDGKKGPCVAISVNRLPAWADRLSKLQLSLLSQNSPIVNSDTKSHMNTDIHMVQKIKKNKKPRTFTYEENINKFQTHTRKIEKKLKLTEEGGRGLAPSTVRINPSKFRSEVALSVVCSRA